MSSKIGLEVVLEQIDAALKLHSDIQKGKRVYSHISNPSKSDYMYDIDPSEAQKAITTLSAVIDRIAPYGSRYKLDAEAIVEQYRNRNHEYPTSYIDGLAGILRALKSDYEAGYLSTLQELVHANLFADFLEMADYFLEQGHKDPAAVIVGGVLEEHLRKLCQKNGLPIEDVTANGNFPKKADRLNSDLASQNVYSKLDQKSITAWLDLRNKAAHGKYSEYTKEQVNLMTQAIRDFLTRYPA